MQGEINIGDTYMIRQKIKRLNQERYFSDFGSFMIKQFQKKEDKNSACNVSAPAKQMEEEQSRLREEVYRTLYSEIKNKGVASRTTIKSWFQKGMANKPKRSHIFRLALALQLSQEALEEYLTKGIHEPGIQINDYREALLLYCLEHKLSIQDWQDMMMVFEGQVNKKTVLAQKTHTLELWKMYQANKAREPEEFLLWMCQSAEFFKGYSNVTLKCFKQYKREVLGYIRKDAKERLLALLEETDFWEERNRAEITDEKLEAEITRYLKNVSRRKREFSLTPEMLELLRELNWTAFSSKDKNRDLLAELYASAIQSSQEKKTRRKIIYRSRKEFALPDNIYFMTEKNLSQLMGIAGQKEKEIHMSQVLGSLSGMKEEEACPADLLEVLQEVGFAPASQTVGEVSRELRKQLVQQEQRCQLVQRDDLLPLIHYTAQRRYYQSIGGNPEKYQQDEARGLFESLAAAALAECQLAPLSTEYQLDYLLLACYGEYDMYSLSDLIEESGELK